MGPFGQTLCSINSERPPFENDNVKRLLLRLTNLWPNIKLNRLAKQLFKEEVQRFNFSWLQLNEINGTMQLHSSWGGITETQIAGLKTTFKISADLLLSDLRDSVFEDGQFEAITRRSDDAVDLFQSELAAVVALYKEDNIPHVEVLSCQCPFHDLTDVTRHLPCKVNEKYLLVEWWRLFQLLCRHPDRNPKDKTCHFAEVKCWRFCSFCKSVSGTISVERETLNDVQHFLLQLETQNGIPWGSIRHQHPWRRYRGPQMKWGHSVLTPRLK